MKKTIVVLLVLVLSTLVLSSCGKKTTNTHKVNNDTNIVNTTNTVKNTVENTASNKAQTNAEADTDALLKDIFNDALKK